MADTVTEVVLEVFDAEDGGGGEETGGGEVGVAGGVYFDGTKRPRIQVLASFGGLLDPGGDYLHLGVGPGLGTAKLSGPGAGTSDTDITDDVRSISLSLRGRPSDIDAADPVTCQLLLRNLHGNYDPSNAASPYAGQLVDGTPIRVRVTWANVAYDRFYGELSNITLNLAVDDAPHVQFEALDGMEKLGRAYLPTQAAADDGDRTGVRVAALADAAGYPSSLRDIDTGYTTLGRTELGASASELMHQVESTEFGLLYVTGGGALTFHDRHHGALASRSISTQATFGDSGIRIPTLELARNRGRIFNRVAITRDPAPIEPDPDNRFNEVQDDAPVEQVADDLASQATRGVLAFPTQVGQLLRNDSDALAMAQYLVSRFKVAQDRISELEVNALRGDWSTLLGLRPLDRVAVIRDYGPNTISEDLQVQGVAEEIAISPPAWVLRFTTSNPPPTPSFFQVGVAQLGSSTTAKLGW